MIMENQFFSQKKRRLGKASRGPAVLLCIVLAVVWWAGGCSCPPEAAAAGGDAAGQAPAEKADPEFDESDESDEFDEFDEFDDFDEFDEFGGLESDAGAGVYDPMIGYNRVMTRVNDRLYFWVLKPTASAYGAILPEGARVSIKRFFKNLSFPVRLVNNLLQFKIKGAGVETIRFGVNSTVGIAGLWDPAAKWLHLEAHEEDFGQTLGYYGLNGGFHLVMPLTGPSNLRDSLASVPDGYLEPLYYVNHKAILIGAPIVDVVNRTSLRIGEYESFSKDAMDMYILFRNAYEQNRKKKVED